LYVSISPSNHAKKALTLNEDWLDWPRYPKEEPETYKDDELDMLLASCDAENKVVV